MNSIFRKLSWLAQRRRKEQQLAAELQFHLEEEAEELQTAGLAQDEARRAARQELGNVGLIQDDTRAAWGWPLAEQFLQDLRYAARKILRSPGFTLVATLTLALGIGANTAIFSFLDALLMRSLPVADPESLVVLNWHSRPPQEGSKEWVHVIHGVQGILWPGDKGAMVSGMFPYGAFETLREENPVFSTLFGYFNGLNRNLAVRGQATSASAEYVSGEYFRGLAVSPAAGRLIDSEDDRPGAAPVAVISFATSQNLFGGPPNAIGQSILVDNIPFTVIGVAPPEFFGVDPAVAPDLPSVAHESARRRRRSGSYV
jgi:hypothetical protein